ncbi:13010_t:CDS:2 [Funneliformis mosseae]|uniref:13010_t:CDS:1 n=1 Tax=Funneliformis mosseae TaxID=27381 RepID=A0A9N9FD09_FUNMO|nr:13010_t:CDS:2 [Funneliformis mosseae]
MELYTQPSIFRILKVFQLLFAFTCLALEITQFVASSKYEPLMLIRLEEFGAFSNPGVKIFFYVVIPLTIVAVGWYLIYFNFYWRNPSTYRDIGIDGFFSILWVTAGLTRLYPVYYNLNPKCPKSENFAYEKHLVCSTYIASLSIGWVNAALFVISTIFSFKLSKELEWRGNINSLSRRQSTSSQFSRRNSSRRSSTRRSSIR